MIYENEKVVRWKKYLEFLMNALAKWEIYKDNPDNKNIETIIKHFNKYSDDEF